MLDKLNFKNDFLVKSINDASFNKYGIIHTKYDFSVFDQILEKKETSNNGNLYVASDLSLESLALKQTLENEVYGQIPIQIGYCNGANSTINGFEYHKCSEMIYAYTDLVLCLGHFNDINDNNYNCDLAEFFYLEKGSVIEIFQTTLHLSPLKVSESGYRSIIVLVKGTNTELDEKCDNGLLFKKNKWIIAHPEREILVSQGVYPGVEGVNKKLEF